MKTKKKKCRNLSKKDSKSRFRLVAIRTNSKGKVYFGQ